MGVGLPRYRTGWRGVAGVVLPAVCLGWSRVFRATRPVAGRSVHYGGVYEAVAEVACGAGSPTCCNWRAQLVRHDISEGLVPHPAHKVPGIHLADRYGISATKNHSQRKGGRPM